MSDQLKIPTLFGDICEMCKCEDQCEVCAFDEDNIKAQAERTEKLKSAIESAIRIKDLWYIKHCNPEHTGEAQALHSMLKTFEDALK